MANLPASQLHPKVAAASVASAVALVGEWAFTQITHNNIPGSVDAGIIVILTFLAGYFVPSGEDVPPATLVVDNSHLIDVAPTDTVV